MFSGPPYRRVTEFEGCRIYFVTTGNKTLGSARWWILDERAITVPGEICSRARPILQKDLACEAIQPQGIPGKKLDSERLNL